MQPKYININSRTESRYAHVQTAKTSIFKGIPPNSTGIRVIAGVMQEQLPETGVKYELNDPKPTVCKTKQSICQGMLCPLCSIHWKAKQLWRVLKQHSHSSQLHVVKPQFQTSCWHWSFFSLYGKQSQGPSSLDWAVCSV